jgi:hypothetical protein
MKKSRYTDEQIAFTLDEKPGDPHGRSGQAAKWSFCLKAASMASKRRSNDEANTPELNRPGFVGGYGGGGGEQKSLSTSISCDDYSALGL